MLVPVGIPCPFGCTYCYTRSGEMGPPRVQPATIVQRFRDFALTHYDAFHAIQLGYDSDPFAYPERGLTLLHGLSMLGKHLNLSTKACIEGEALAGLAEIRAHLASHLVLSALVSLSCWESALVVEPHTPTPAQRMLTIRTLKRIGVPSLVAVRPVLPHITDDEYAQIFEEALLAGCVGFVFGPLYADAEERFVRFVPKEALSKSMENEVEGDNSPSFFEGVRLKWTGKGCALFSCLSCFYEYARIPIFIERRNICVNTFFFVVWHCCSFLALSPVVKAAQPPRLRQYR